MKINSLESLPEGKKILLRLDLNSPCLNKKIIYNPRFKEAEETLHSLIKKKSAIVILAHQGRSGDSDFLPLKQHATLLSKHLKRKVLFVPDLFGKKAESAIKNLKAGEILMLQNVRFYEDDSPKSKGYKELCKLFNCYINDAFSVCHRNQGSLVIPPRYLKSYSGPHLEKELSAISLLLSSKNKRIVYLIGGSKADDYIPLCSKLKSKKTRMLVSGVFANLFLISSGLKLGYENFWSEEQGYDVFYPQLKKILKANPDKIILPVDVAVGSTDPNKAVRCEMSLKEAPFSGKIWDVGPGTITLFKKYLSDADIVFMKGPLGYSEIPAFGYGTVEMLKHISELKSKGIYTFLGGGHLTTTLDSHHIPHTFSHISTSGGSLMHALAGKNLPGIEALKKSKN